MWPFKRNPITDAGSPYATEENPHNLRKILAISNILVIIFSLQLTWPTIAEKLNIGKPSVDCLKVWEESMETMTAYPVYYEAGKPPSGYWECLSPSFQKVMFIQNSWNNDKDVQAWFDKLATNAQVLFRIQEYSGGPVYSCTTDQNGNTVCDEKVLVLVKVYDYVPGDMTTLPQWVYDAKNTFAVTIHIDDQGLIGNIE